MTGYEFTADYLMLLGFCALAVGGMLMCVWVFISIVRSGELYEDFDYGV